MTMWLCVAAAIGSLIFGSFLLRWWVSARGIANVIERAAPALIEAGEFFTLLDLSGPDAHFLERHGPMLKASDALQRARTGRLDVAGHTGKPVTSGRWHRHVDMLRATTSAADHWESGVRPKGGRFLFAFEQDIGEGYLKGGGELVTTRVAIVIVRHGAVITAYPALALVPPETKDSGWPVLKGACD